MVKKAEARTEVETFDVFWKSSCLGYVDPKVIDFGTISPRTCVQRLAERKRR